MLPYKIQQFKYLACLLSQLLFFIYVVWLLITLKIRIFDNKTRKKQPPYFELGHNWAKTHSMAFFIRPPPELLPVLGLLKW